MPSTSEDRLPNCITHVVEREADVLIVSHDAGRLARAMGFTEVAVAELRIVARELTTNILKYAQRGTIALITRDDRLIIEATDHGPGITNLGLAMEDGYSSSGSLGYGLGTVNRIMDSLEISSNAVEGTHIIASKALRALEPPSPDLPVEIGVASVPKPGSAENGDGYIVHSWGRHTLVGVCDGVGHGALAHAASAAATRYIETHVDQPFDGLFRGLGFALHGTRGAVLALARFDWDSSAMEFCGVGNIEARVLNSSWPVSLLARRGILGGAAPAPHIATYHWDTAATLLMFSDGISSHWNHADELAGLSAQAAAHAVLQQHNRFTDDATVLVMRPPVLG